MVTMISGFREVKPRVGELGLGGIKSDQEKWVSGGN